MNRTAFTWIELLVVIAVIVILLALLGVGIFFEVPFQLLFGWVPFLYRSFFRMQLDGGATLTAVVCLIGLIAGLHLFLRWWRAQKQPECPWRLGATVSLVGVVVLMFVAGVSAVGITHQTAWLMNSPEPWVSSGRITTARSRSTHNLRGVGLALHNHNDHFGKMPPGALIDADGRLLHGWQTLLLPYLEEDALFKSIKTDIAWNHPDNAPAFTTTVGYYLHPAVPVKMVEGCAASHYAGNVHVLGGDRARAIPQDFPDGLTNTMLGGEVASNYRPWGHPMNWRDPMKGFNKSPDGFGSPSKKPTLILLGDASVRSINDDVSPAVLKALSTPDGGEKMPDDY